MSIDMPAQTQSFTNPFATKSFSSTSPAAPTHTPFAAANGTSTSFPPASSRPAKSSPFGSSTQNPSPFLSSQPTSSFGQPSGGVFGAPSQPTTTGVFGAPSATPASTPSFSGNSLWRNHNLITQMNRALILYSASNCTK